MRFLGHTTVCLVLVTLLLGTLIAQDFQAQIDALEAKRQELYKKMEEAPDTDSYNAAKAEYDQVIADLEAVVEKANAGKNEAALAKQAFNQGGGFLKKKQYVEAVEQFNKAIEKDPEYISAYYMKGYALSRLKNYPEATVSYQKVLELDPKHSNTIFALGKLYEVQGQGKKAIELYEQVGDAKAHHSVGTVYLGWKAYPEAVSAFSKAIDVDSTYALSYIGWGTALIELGKTSEAIAKLQTATSLDSKSSDAYFRLATALNKTGKYSDALSASENAITLTRKKAEKANGYIEKGNALEGLGRKAEAKTAFLEAAKMDKKYKEWVEYHIEEMK